MVHVEKLSKQGSSQMNEDAFIINQQENIYGVVDGVSSLVPYLNERDETGGFIAANLLKQYFEKHTGPIDFCKEIQNVNSLLQVEMIKAKIDIPKKESLWGAALALIKINPTTIEYVQTGDCMIFAIYEDGTVRVLTHPQVDHLETIAFEKWVAGISQGLATRSQLMESVQDILKQNRRLANTTGGYGVLNGEENVVDFLEYGRINRGNLKHVLLLTDGLFTYTTPEESHKKWIQTVQPILEKGLEQYTADLIMLEESDPECIQYIRFKKSDDKTGVVIHF